jgi:hypothetical protein
MKLEGTCYIENMRFSGAWGIKTADINLGIIIRMRIWEEIGRIIWVYSLL